MALLVAGGDLTCRGIVAQVGLAKAMGEPGDFFAVGGYAENGAGRPTDCAPCLSWFADKETTILLHFQGGCEFAGLGGLVDLGTKQFMVVGFTIVVSVLETPQTIAVEHEDFLLSQAKPQRFVQARCEP